MSTRSGTWRDAISLSVGTFTIVPVPPPKVVDKGTAARALVLSVLIGALIGAGMWGIVLLFEFGWDSSFIAALAAVTFSTAMTRGLHLDGLADTTDGLGSRRFDADGVAIMRKSDIGPFAIVALLLDLLTQIACITVLAFSGLIWMLIVIQAAGRGAAVLACLRSMPVAKPEGLGSAVTRSINRPTWIVVVLTLTGASAATALLPGVQTNDAFRLVTALLVGWLSAYALLRLSIRRFGGVTGDVIGAAIEVAITVMLVVAAATAF